MLTVRFENIGKKVEILYEKLGLSQPPCGANFVMYDGNDSVALWRMQIIVENGQTVGVIDKIAFLPSVEIGDKTFFVHAMFFKLQEGAPMLLRINGEHKELERFGFEFDGKNMQIISSNINLHYSCGVKKG